MGCFCGLRKGASFFALPSTEHASVTLIFTRLKDVLDSSAIPEEFSFHRFRRSVLVLQFPTCVCVCVCACGASRAMRGCTVPPRGIYCDACISCSTHTLCALCTTQAPRPHAHTVATVHTCCGHTAEMHCRLCKDCLESPKVRHTTSHMNVQPRPVDVGLVLRQEHVVSTESSCWWTQCYKPPATPEFCIFGFPSSRI